MSKYIDRLKAQGTDQARDKQFAQAAARAGLQLEADLLETRSQLQQAKDDLDTAKSATPLSFQNISNEMDRVEGLEKGLARLEALKVEMFG